METKISFDIIMDNCPFLKSIIENKISEEVGAVQKENQEQKKTIDGLGKQLAAEKLSTLKNVNALNALGRELAETKIKLMGGK